MIKKEEFMDILNDILIEGKVENVPLSNIDILKDILKDNDLTNLFFLEFEKNYPYDDDILVCKTQDFIYRLNLAVNEWLIPKHNLTSVEDIKSKLFDLVFDDIDLYSAVNYNDFDKEIIEDFEELFPQEDISI